MDSHTIKKIKRKHKKQLSLGIGEIISDRNRISKFGNENK